MPLALSPIHVSQTLQPTAIISGGGDSGTKAAGTEVRGGSTGKSAPLKTAIPLGETVTLAAASAPTTASYIPAAPYAEIWKDGRKMAEIDSRGDVSAFDGLVAAPASGGSGLALAAQRAAQIARSVGGEILVAGLVTDIPTLAMHARLSEAYGG